MKMMNEVRNMLNKKGLWSALLVCFLLFSGAAYSDGLQDLVLSKLDGKGSVDSINVARKTIVVNDRLYSLDNRVTVFDVVNRKNSSIEKVKVGDTVGFKSKALSKPTAPYDQLIVKIWILKNSK